MKEVVDEGRWLATQPSRTAEEVRERFTASLDDENRRTVVCVDDGRIIGSASTYETGIAGVWSLGTWILAPYRGRGLGRRLLDLVVAEAAAAGARKVELEVFTDNAVAIALYEAAGFELEGVRRDHYAREDGSIKSAALMALFPGESGR
jgi:RimJ/RimL family protein N-acetyltransferase